MCSVVLNKCCFFSDVDLQSETFEFFAQQSFIYINIIQNVVATIGAKFSGHE
jgi:hypothetical protein